MTLFISESYIMKKFHEFSGCSIRLIMQSSWILLLCRLFYEIL